MIVLCLMTNRHSILVVTSTLTISESGNLKIPMKVLQCEREFSKMNTLCAVSRGQVYGFNPQVNLQSSCNRLIRGCWVWQIVEVITFYCKQVETYFSIKSFPNIVQYLFQQLNLKLLRILLFSGKFAFTKFMRL